ncbi:uroporphyrinogen-III C-methyltransferase [Pseudomaricurvus alcaniphilus]|uniref:siroheme synthase CysG n=1 Tax=Pseudomaricurvus alcaniphilus TaxID=1166482 RepID=UPI001407BEAC|nr:siroheme synthase CysG [Pseudomaricurvus alcaniphilus]NHN35822.1 uroporphyrinogen-III C-methyltransferase [Pseudomaricurvus alcaniphilus]
MDYFPLFIKLQHKPCLVVGGGQVARRKVLSLLESGACLTVEAPVLCDELQALVDSHRLSWFAEPFQEQEPLDSYFLVVAATDDASVNRDIAERCNYLGVHCNVASEADEGDTLLPAIIERSPLTIAVHSSAQSPTVTRYLKRQLEAFVPPQMGALARWAEGWREPVKQRLGDLLSRRRLWDKLLSGVASAQVMAGHEASADAIMEQHLEEAAAGRLSGEVFLVGAGPGDPELLTLKALRLIQQADIVLYDRLVSEAIMELLPADCERLYVGKRQSEHSVPQTEINQLLVDYARQGRNVLRLKGGDPFIFGRGGEEIELLASAGISFQVVPGITAANGCACYAGIPLTHRDYAQSVRFITGHLQSDKVNLDWPELARPNQTLVFYMGLSGLGEICAALIANRRAPETPAALIEKGTTPQQRVLVADLESLPQLAQTEAMSAPTLLIIGEVVQLQKQLAWY